jgi:hypothetical protein
VIQLDVRTDIRQAERFFTNLRRNGVKSAAARAINDTLITLRAEGARMIKRDHPALSIGAIKAAITMKRAHKFNLRGMVATTGKPQTLLLFKVRGGDRPFRFGKTSRAGIYNVTRAARVRPLTAQVGKSRSVMQMHGRKAFRVAAYGNEVFVRRFAKGRQIRRLRGPSLPGVFRAKGNDMKTLAQQRWAVAFRSRMAYEIGLAKSVGGIRIGARS